MESVDKTKTLYTKSPAKNTFTERHFTPIADHHAKSRGVSGSNIRNDERCSRFDPTTGGTKKEASGSNPYTGRAGVVDSPLRPAAPRRKPRRVGVEHSQRQALQSIRPYDRRHQTQRAPMRVPFVFGAGGRGRTDTVSLPLDFESSTSANSITPAYE